MTICTKCKKSLGWLTKEYQCARCRQIFCSTCIIKTPIEGYARDINDLVYPSYKTKNRILYHYICACPSCENVIKAHVNQIDKSINTNQHVEIVSENYKGRKHYDYNGFLKDIETNFHKDMNDALEELKILARYYNCDMVIDVHKERKIEETESDNGKGTYKYSVWSYSGKACQKYHK